MKFHAFSPEHAANHALPSRIQEYLPIPALLMALDINALNYCSFSALPRRNDAEEKGGTLVAVPHTLDSGFIDIMDVPSGKRVQKAVGKPDIQSSIKPGDRAGM